MPSAAPAPTGDAGASGQSNHIAEPQVFLQIFEQVTVGEPAVCDHRYLHPLGHHVPEPIQQLVLVTVAVVFQRRRPDRLPHHARGPTMLGEHRQHQRIVPVASKACPIQGHHDLLSCSCHMWYPMRKEVVQLDGAIAEQSVDLLHPMFAQCSTGVGQSLSNGVHAQRGTGEDSERTVGKRQHPLGVKIPIVQLVDGGNQMVFAKYGSGFHYALCEAKEDILLPISCPYKFEAELGRKGRAKYATDLTHLGCKMRTRSQQSRLSSCTLGSNQIFSSSFLEKR